MIRVIEGDCRDSMRALIAEGVRVQTIVTSPPYFGLRDYGTATWEGGNAACDHIKTTQHRDQSDRPRGWDGNFRYTSQPLPVSFGSDCGKCGAVRIDQQIGLESTPAEFIAKLVDVFAVARDLLADDGTVWLNMGDAYAGSWGARGRGEHTNAPSPQLEEKYGTTAPARNGFIDMGIKPKDLLGMPWRLAFALQADGWYLRQDIIWCLSGGAAVYARTQKGDMPVMVKDLVRLRPETVKLWNGQKWTQVLGWSQSIDTGGALEIELRSGERIGCTQGHQWPTKRGLIRAADLRVGDVIETTRLPEPETPNDAKALDEDVAWLCGLYLAEGSMSGDKVQLAGHSKETESRMLRIEHVAAAFHGSTTGYTDGNTASIVVYGPVIAAVIRAYIHGNTAQDKGLKVRVWQRSNAWLRSLLNGYLAGDGHYDADNDRWRLGFCRNDRLADDFRTLAARLGLSIRLNAETVTGFGRQWQAYRGDIRLVPTTHHNARVGGEITVIRPSRARQFWDIGVEDDPHIFALASGVLTHNSKPNPMPESVTDRCTKAHEYLFLLSKSARYFFDAEAIREEGEGYGRSNWNAPQFKCGDITRNHGGKGESGKGGGTPTYEGGRNKRSVWTVATQPFSEAHFATFPPALIEPCILAGSRPGDLVLDPFGGAGTTGLVADRFGRDAILCELNAEYAAMARRRIFDDAPLFAEVA